MAPRQTTNRSHLRKLLFGLIALVALAFVVYGPGIRGPFIWDDAAMVSNNSFIRAPNGLSGIWGGKDVDYLPLTSTVFWCEWRLFADNPVGYRVVNLLLHAGSCFLVWRILRGLRVPAAGFAAALFCVHPVCVGTVVWIAELKNTLSVFLACLSAYLFLCARPASGNKTSKAEPWNEKLFVFSIVAFVLALLSKVSVVMLPFVLLGFLTWRRAGGWLRTAPFFAASLGFGLLNVLFQHHRAMKTAAATDIAPLLPRVLDAGYALWFYCVKCFVPIGLMPIYPRWHIDSTVVGSGAPLFTWVLLLCMLWWLSRRSALMRIVFVGFTFFTVTAIPVLGFVPISFLLQTPVADHLQYFPMIGIVVVLAVIVQTIVARFFSGPKADTVWAMPIAVVVCVALFGTLSFRHSELFANPEMLWRDNVAKNPRASMAWANLAGEYERRGNYDQAVKYYRQSLELDSANDMVRENLAQVLNQGGHPNEAEAELRTVIAHQPNGAHLHNNLGALLSARGELTEAVTHFQLAVKLAPENEQAHDNLGSAYARLGRYDEAIAEFEQVLRIDPRDAQAQSNLIRARELKAANKSRD